MKKCFDSTMNHITININELIEKIINIYGDMIHCRIKTFFHRLFHCNHISLYWWLLNNVNILNVTCGIPHCGTGTIHNSNIFSNF